MINIRSIREAAGMTGTDIARGLGYSENSGRQTVSQLEARNDWLLSKLVDYIRAAGGSAVLTVTLPNEVLEFNLT